MPTVLSTLRDSIYGREWSFPYNCYEVGHGWTPYCTEAAIDVGAAAFQNVLPLYTSLYLFTQLGLQRKYNLEAFGETFKSILTSASFLGFNLFAGLAVSCTLRNNSDRYYYRVQCLLPGFLASYMALLVERPSRRPALAFYMANMSSELLFKWYVDAGYLRPWPYGETILFAVGMACWLRFVRIHGFGHDPVSTALKYLIGSLEAKSRASRPIEPAPAPAPATSGDKQLSAASGPMECQQGFRIGRLKEIRPTSTLVKLDERLNALLNNYFAAHPMCPHKGTSCLHYTLSPTVTRFVWGYTGRSLLNLAARFRLLAKRPDEAVSQAFKSRNSLNFGLFLASLVGASRLTHCLMRRLTGKQEVWHSTLAGALSGCSMLFAPRSTLSIYVIWKCLEQYFFLAVKNGQIKCANECVGLIYSVSVNILLYIFALQPNFIRPSYMKFIDKVSEHKLHQVNRMGESLSVFAAPTIA